MTNTKIHKDEVDWLISVYKTSNDEELQNESLDKLLNYGLNKNQIEERFKIIKSEKDEVAILNLGDEEQLK